MSLKTRRSRVRKNESAFGVVAYDVILIVLSIVLSPFANMIIAKCTDDYLFFPWVGFVLVVCFSVVVMKISFVVARLVTLFVRGSAELSDEDSFFFRSLTSSQVIALIISLGTLIISVTLTVDQYKNVVKFDDHKVQYVATIPVKFKSDDGQYSVTFSAYQVGDSASRGMGVGTYEVFRNFEEKVSEERGKALKKLREQIKSGGPIDGTYEFKKFGKDWVFEYSNLVKENTFIPLNVTLSGSAQ